LYAETTRAALLAPERLGRVLRDIGADPIAKLDWQLPVPAMLS